MKSKVKRTEQWKEQKKLIRTDIDAGKSSEQTYKHLRAEGMGYRRVQFLKDYRRMYPRRKRKYAKPYTSKYYVDAFRTPSGAKYDTNVKVKAVNKNGMVYWQTISVGHPRARSSKRLKKDVQDILRKRYLRVPGTKVKILRIFPRGGYRRL